MSITGTKTGPLESADVVDALSLALVEVEVVVAKQTAGLMGISLIFFFSCD